MSGLSELNEALRKLREQYKKELPAKLSEIDHLFDELCDAEKFELETLHTLHRRVHALTGSGGTFGFTALGNTARILEIALKECEQENAASLAEDVLNRLIVQWNEVKSAANSPDAEPAEQSGNMEGAEPVVKAGASIKEDDACILLLENDAEQARNFQVQLGHFGYAVKVLHDPSLLNSVIKEAAPSVIIMCVDFPGSNLSGAQSLALIPEEIRGNIPVIFISSRGDMNSRLISVRAGAIAYFTKPLDMGQLVDTLDRLTSIATSDPFKILIVEDSPSLASFYAMTLQSAGMETVVVTDPLKALDAMHEFTPELILVDLYMPGCNGLELAKIIRQQESYVSTPIVFLSAETDVEMHLEAMKFGADDFLMKSIQADHLVSSVTSRVLRYRILRSYMVRDSLTGLLNHTKIKEELEVEIMRAERQGGSLVFAMIDIDNFKRINDSYGHATGDRVIKSISRLLQQRLRKTDVIGRYGGEEFAVILKDTDAASAFATLDNIRMAFEKIAQHSDSNKFSVTFSCGVAAFQGFSSASEISNAADKALYEAKRGGRNRVVLAR